MAATRSKHPRTTIWLTRRGSVSFMNGTYSHRDRRCFARQRIRLQDTSARSEVVFASMESGRSNRFARLGRLAALLAATASGCGGKSTEPAAPIDASTDAPPDDGHSVG